jgi:ring-1,2-phenylacetyl-CoA epoxidase subunit PaaD
MVSRRDIDAALERVPDPELPLSIVELGMVCGVESDGAAVVVNLVPTYTGCPALPMIERDVLAKVAAVPGVISCVVRWCYEPAWTPDRITEPGRDKLRAHGVTTPCLESTEDDTVPLTVSAPPCPYCGATGTRLDSPFGPTRCRSIFFCEACRNQFEHIKPVS